MSGADYAEYMRKGGDFNAAKGDIMGIDASGRLTDRHADATAFEIKSTNPLIVGGDVWVASVGERPVEPLADAPQEAKDAYAAALAEYTARLEAERVTVDCVAFADQVPVKLNVLGAAAGDYIVPVPSESRHGGIRGVAVKEDDITLALYRKAVGRVINLLPDGRANVIVMVH